MYEKEILKKVGGDYKPLSDKIQLIINKISADETELNITFKIGAKTIVTNISYMDSCDHVTFYGMHVKRLLGLIEKNLYELLPAFNITPVAELAEMHTKIRIDNHIPDNVVLMSPKTYIVYLSSSRDLTFLKRDTNETER